MKVSSIATLLGLAHLSTAFPAAAFQEVEADPELQAKVQAMLEKRQGTGANDAAAIFEPVPIYNGQKQYIDIGPGSGHQFVAPGPNDQRGPCPGLNAFANHGFLPHNGYANAQQFIDATMSVVGMGIGLASFLAVYGSAINGNGVAWSIGGTPAGGQSKGNGISNSHNNYEGDASPLRPDLYQFGNDYNVRTQQYQILSEMGSNYNLDVLTKFRKKRFDTQVAQNGFFFNGPFTGVLVQPAAYTFIYRFMANHTQENPQGYLSHSTFESWFSITGKSGSYKWTPGHEKIPPNWYRRPAIYNYEQLYFLADVANAAKIYPEFLNIGGNTGKPNTFTGVDVGEMSGGVFNGQNFANRNSFACLAYQFSANAKPDIVENSGLLRMRNRVKGILRNLQCPQLTAMDAKQLNQFPGYRRSGSPYGTGKLQPM